VAWRRSAAGEGALRCCRREKRRQDKRRGERREEKTREERS